MFSFNKLVALVVIIMAVWYAFRLFARLERARREAARPVQTEVAPRRRRPGAEELTRCVVCGVYMLPTARAGCARPDCPFG